MTVRIYAIMNENIEYKIQKVKGDNVSKEIADENHLLREEREELKSRIGELENRIKRHSATDIVHNSDHESKSNRDLIRSKSPIPIFPKEYDIFSSRKFSKEERRDLSEIQIYNNRSEISANYNQDYASPVTKSMSDRSWIENKEISQNATIESAQFIIERLTKVITHLQNELSKNSLLISQLMDENRQYQIKNESSYMGNSQSNNTEKNFK